MIKAKKGLLIALFATMMVFAFGATSAFAATDAGHSFNGKSFASIESVPADTEGLKVLVEPTCDEEGVGEIACDVDLNGEACGAVRTVKIDPLGHKLGDTVRMSTEELFSYFGITDKDAQAAWHNSHKDLCEAYVSICPNCKKLVRERSRDGEIVPITSMSRSEIKPDQWTAHTAPDNVPECADTYTCKVCGFDGCPITPTAEHEWLTEERDAHIIKHGSTDKENWDYVSVTTKTCSVCGAVEGPVTALHGAYLDNPESIKHGATTRVEIPSDKPCQTASGYSDVCNDCGMEVSAGLYPLAAHTWVTSQPYTKDDGYLYTNEYCAVCETIKLNSEKRIGFAPEDSGYVYSYDAVSPANCEQGSFIAIKVASESGLLLGTVYLSDEEFLDEVDDGVFVKIGEKYYNVANKKEVPFTEAIEHKFGTLTKIADATCTEASLEAKVCENCNKVDHDTVRHIEKALGHEVKPVKVDATCGTYGYTYNICTRCNEYLSEDGKDVVEAMDEFDLVKPVVALGTECSYDWKVLEEATPFTLGTRAKVCTVCNDELFATKESIPKTTIAAPAVKAKKGKKAVVTVKAVEGAVSYQILVNGKVKVKNAKVGKNTVKKLTGKKAKVQIKAFDANGVAAKSKAKTVKVKK